MRHHQRNMFLNSFCKFSTNLSDIFSFTQLKEFCSSFIKFFAIFVCNLSIYADNYKSSAALPSKFPQPFPFMQGIRELSQLFHQIFHHFFQFDHDSLLDQETTRGASAVHTTPTSVSCFKIVFNRFISRAKSIHIKGQRS